MNRLETKSSYNEHKCGYEYISDIAPFDKV